MVSRPEKAAIPWYRYGIAHQDGAIPVLMVSHRYRKVSLRVTERGEAWVCTEIYCKLPIAQFLAGIAVRSILPVRQNVWTRVDQNNLNVESNNTQMDPNNLNVDPNNPKVDPNNPNVDPNNPKV